MRVLSCIISEAQNEMTVKKYLRSILRISARAMIKQKYIENGILLNGEQCRVIDVLHTGDELKLILEYEESSFEPLDVPLDVLINNDDFFVVNKPLSMPVHPSPGHDKDSLLNAVTGYYKGKLRPLYRLDKDTTGILVLGKHRIAVSSTKISKEYYAIVEGKLEGKGEIDKPIRLTADSKIKREVGGSDTAITEYECIAYDGEHSLVKCKLVTGRTHQIRVHMAAVGNPLAGDDLYGGSKKHIDRQALHCKHAELENRALGFEKTIDVPFPEDMINAFPALLSENAKSEFNGGE